MKKVAIGVMTYNRLGFLKQCLQTIYMANPNSYQVVVSDDGSIDGTPDFLTQESRDKGIHAILSHRGGVARNGNRLLRYAKDNDIDVLFILNDDIEVRPGAFEVYLDAIEKTGYHHFCYRDPKAPHKIINYFEENGVLLNECLVGDGAFMTFTRAMIDKLGGFDTGFSMYGCEHSSLTRRASQEGFSRNVLDVADAAGKVFVSQYYFRVPGSIDEKDRHRYLAISAPRWHEMKLGKLQSYYPLICD